MRNKGIMLKLADVLSKLDPSKFSMTTHGKDALYYLAQIPEAKKHGFRYTASPPRKNGEKEIDMVWFNDVPDVHAAKSLFGISDHEAMYLFGPQERDIYGWPQESPFECDRPASEARFYRDKFPANVSSTIDWRSRRDFEPPAWTAGRLRAFANGLAYDNGGKSAA